MPTNDQIKMMADRLESPSYWQTAADDAAVMLRELLAEREWRDMDSAPRDGNFILTYSPDEFDGKQITIRCWGKRQLGSWNEQGSLGRSVYANKAI